MNAAVSVIIPTYNRARLLKRAVDSVLAQTYGDFELIVVSDGSTDDTEDVVTSYKDPRVVLLKHDKRKGASAARNTGMKASRGKYIAFLDDDDEWVPLKLEVQVPVIERSSAQVGLVYAWMEYYEKGRSKKILSPRLKGDVFREMLDKQAIGGCPTIMIKREVMDTIGYFDENLPRGNDGDYWRRISRHYHVDYVPEILARIHTGHGDHISALDERGIRNAIKGQSAKLIKFENELREYPRQAANIYMNIGFYYGQLGEWKKSLSYYGKALGLRPFRAGLYLKMMKGIAKGIANRIKRK